MSESPITIRRYGKGQLRIRASDWAVEGPARDAIQDARHYAQQYDQAAELEVALLTTPITPPARRRGA